MADEKLETGKKPYTATIGDVVIEEWNYEIFIQKISDAKKKLTEKTNTTGEYLKG